MYGLDTSADSFLISLQALIEYVGTRFTSSAVFCIYEPIGPNDPFGHNMVENLRVGSMLFHIRNQPYSG